MVVWKRRTVLALIVLIGALGLMVVPALAAPPSQGTVIEGVRVPGPVGIGYSRAQVDAVFGAPAYCQGPAQDFCTFYVNNSPSATVNVRYQNEQVHSISWSQAVNGWITTAGINTTLALNNPNAVIAAYPDAEVTYDQFGNVFEVRDWTGGLQVNWFTDYLSGTVRVQMQIFAPWNSPPTPPPAILRVAAVDMAAARRAVSATVHVIDGQGINASGATVAGTWTLPNGTIQRVVGKTDGFGRVQFVQTKARRGTYNFEVNTVVLDGYTFDSANSVLSGQITK